MRPGGASCAEGIRTTVDTSLAAEEVGTSLGRDIWHTGRTREAVELVGRRAPPRLSAMRRRSLS